MKWENGCKSSLISSKPDWNHKDEKCKYVVAY